MTKLLTAIISIALILSSCGYRESATDKAANTYQFKKYNLVGYSVKDIQEKIEEEVASKCVVVGSSVSLVEEAMAVEEEKRPEINGVDLEPEILDYIWVKSIESEFAYTYLLAIAKTESDFDLNARSKTRDHGLYQLHGSTAKWLAKELNIKNPNYYDWKNNIDMAVYYLETLRDAWDGNGYSGELMFDLITISYNRGVSGCKRYIKKYGIESNQYLATVLKNKEELEGNIIG